jgi:hypothetical protein
MRNGQSSRTSHESDPSCGGGAVMACFLDVPFLKPNWTQGIRKTGVSALLRAFASASNTKMIVLYLLFLLLWSTDAFPQNTTPLCASGTRISYPAPGFPPIAGTWSQGDNTAGRVAIDCTRWLQGNFKLNVALAASFDYAGSASNLLRRFGEISRLRGVRYWSIHDGRWETLITEADAVTDLTSERREDFNLDELNRGRDLYFQQSDNRTPGPIVYRMRIENRGSMSLVVRITNVSSVHFLLLSVFKPGDLQSVYVLERLSPGTWSYFNLLGIQNNMSFAASPANSWINRAFALYRHYTDIPTDQDPPFIRH